MCAASKGMVFAPFLSENGIWSLESEKVFDETTYLFFQFQMNKEEREICILEGNFVSFIDDLIVSFSKYMKIRS